VVRTDVDEYRARAVVVAAGAWVPKLLGGRLPLPPLRVTREQPVHFRALEPDQRWPSFIEHAPEASFTTYGLLSPGEGVKLGEHMVGPVVDADHVDRTPDPAATARVVAHARRYLPGVDPVPTQVETCLYTTTANEDFVIDRRGPLTVASPCSGHGFKFGPATGELVARVAVGEVTAPPRFRL
jgi:sarcosine oxidase